MSKENNKFFNQITVSHKGIREQRALNLSKRAQMEQEQYVRDLESKQLDLEAKIDQLADLGPKSTMSLDNPDISAKDWVRDMNKAVLDLALLEERINIANEISKEWFNA